MTRIKSLDQIQDLAEEGRSVYCECTKRRVFPADVMLGMTGRTIMRLMNYGAYVYEPKKRDAHWTKVLDVSRKGDMVKGHKHE